MAIQLDETHDAQRKSWIASANGHGVFPIQNLPLGIFSINGDTPRGGVAIGDEVFDLKAACEAKLFSGDAEKAARAASNNTLNDLMAMGGGPRAALRKQLSALLAEGTVESKKAQPLAAKLLHKASACTLHLPAKIGAFTDFFAGITHAENGGKRRGSNPPLSPNYKYVPVAYHSRASTVRPTGVEVRRPNGQRVVDGEKLPTFGPCLKMDFELEFGVWIGQGNAWGEPIPTGKAADHIFGYCMLNDWSARDIQSWESAPLGPFLAKSASTSISPWIVMADALAPFLGVLFEAENLKNILGSVVADAGKNQIRMAETEKYPHVTYFLNGGREEQYRREDRIMVPSPKVATYDLQPEMSAREVTDKLVEAINSKQYAAIVCNFANDNRYRCRKLSR